MKKRLIVFLGCCIACLASYGQQRNSSDSNYLLMINQRIDDYVVQRNTISLDSLYANDFVFSHGTGKVEGKSSWLTSVVRNNFPQRQHDSVKVEMHPGVAILKGSMNIQRVVNKEKTDRYHLRYIRVYAWRDNRWQLISHNTTYESHE